MEDKKCVMCDRLWGLFGLVLSLAFLYISVDVLTNGAITSALSGNRTELIGDEDD